MVFKIEDYYGDEAVRVKVGREGNCRACVKTIDRIDHPYGIGRGQGNMTERDQPGLPQVSQQVVTKFVKGDPEGPQLVKRVGALP